jgi:hypothetical protein
MQASLTAHTRALKTVRKRPVRMTFRKRADGRTHPSNARLGEGCCREAPYDLSDLLPDEGSPTEHSASRNPWETRRLNERVDASPALSQIFGRILDA